MHYCFHRFDDDDDDDENDGKGLSYFNYFIHCWLACDVHQGINKVSWSLLNLNL